MVSNFIQLTILIRPEP